MPQQVNRTATGPNGQVRWVGGAPMVWADGEWAVPIGFPLIVGGVVMVWDGAAWSPLPPTPPPTSLAFGY